MFATIKQIFSPNCKDLRQRLLFTLGVLSLFILGCSIRVPGTTDLTGNLGFLELLNTMGGGALEKFSIFGLGVMPYISASIIVQLLEMDIVPYFVELSKQGHSGRQKLNQITRYMGIGFAFIEGFAFSYAYYGAGYTLLQHMYISVVLTAGTAFLLWLGDQITQKGIGNGVSLIIAAGIIATLPQMFITAFQGLTTDVATWVGILKFVAFVIVYLLIVVGVIFVESAVREVPIQYANKSTSVRGKNHSYMPIKLNSANVIPVIFASSLVAVPATIAQFVKNESFSTFVNKYIVYTSATGFLFYALLIIFFAYFYTFIQLKPDDLAKNLQDSGGYIPGVVPGNATNKYVSNILGRLTIVGALSLIALSGLPIIFQKISGLPQSVSIGGTGLLIVVGVAVETYKQLEGSIIARNYKKGYSRRR